MHSSVLGLYSTHNILLWVVAALLILLFLFSHLATRLAITPNISHSVQYDFSISSQLTYPHQPPNSHHVLSEVLAMVPSYTVV